MLLSDRCILVTKPGPDPGSLSASTPGSYDLVIKTGTQREALPRLEDYQSSLQLRRSRAGVSVSRVSPPMPRLRAYALSLHFLQVFRRWIRETEQECKRFPGLLPASREFSEAAVVGTNTVLVMKAAWVQIPALQARWCERPQAILPF